MYGVHSCVVTKSKPWTTVASSFQGTDIDVLKLCQVKLVYLGNHKYGKLIAKDFIGQSLYITPSFNVASMIQPPLPPALPNPPAPTLVQELETVNTLLDLHGSKNTEKSNESVTQQNTATSVELPNDADAMDKIVGYCEMSVTVINVLNVTDAMDSITHTEPELENLPPIVLNVETIKQENEPPVVLNVEMVEQEIESESEKQVQTLNVETSKLKECHVCVRPLENILFDETKPDPSVPKNDIPSGEHYTHSRARKPAVRTGCIPHRASSGKQYEEQNDTPSPKKRRSISAKPSASGPSDTRIPVGDYHQFLPTGMITIMVTVQQTPLRHLQKHHQHPSPMLHPPR